MSLERHERPTRRHLRQLQIRHRILQRRLLAGGTGGAIPAPRSSTRPTRDRDRSVPDPARGHPPSVPASAPHPQDVRAEHHANAIAQPLRERRHRPSIAIAQAPPAVRSARSAERPQIAQHRPVLTQIRLLPQRRLITPLADPTPVQQPLSRRAARRPLRNVQKPCQGAERVLSHPMADSLRAEMAAAVSATPRAAKCSRSCNRSSSAPWNGATATPTRCAPSPTPPRTPTSRPHAFTNMRHSFVSLMIAQGSTVVEVARQAGHASTMILSTSAHLYDEQGGADHRPAEEQIRTARFATPSPEVSVLCPCRGGDLATGNEKPPMSGAFAEPTPGLEPGTPSLRGQRVGCGRSRAVRVLPANRLFPCWRPAHRLRLFAGVALPTSCPLRRRRTPRHRGHRPSDARTSAA